MPETEFKNEKTTTSALTTERRCLLTLFAVSARLLSALMLITFLQMAEAQAQGCSDAGFCTMGAMRPNQFFSRKINLRLRSVEITQYFGYTKFQDVILSTIADVNIGISERSSVQFKLPYTLVYSKLDKNQGLGDVSVSFTHALLVAEKYQLSVTAGTKIPTNGATQQDAAGHSNPSYLQTSLGTYDGILGLSLVSRKWLFAIGYQQPFNTTDNQFTKATWAGDPDSAVAARYPNARQLQRGNDMMLRIERNFRFSRWNGYLGLLPIYRFNRDVVTDEKGIRKPVENSNGLVLNLLTGTGYRFSVKSSVKLLLGFKLIERKLNPDGLSREFVSTLGYEYRF